MEVVGQRFIFDASGAVYICVSRYNESVHFRMKMSFLFYSFYFYLTLYMLQITCVLSHYRSVAFVYSRADREYLTALRRPCLLTWIDLLHSYRTGPQWFNNQHRIKIGKQDITLTATYKCCLHVLTLILWPQNNKKTKKNQMFMAKSLKDEFRDVLRPRLKSLEPQLCYLHLSVFLYGVTHIINCKYDTSSLSCNLFRVTKVNWTA